MWFEILTLINTFFIRKEDEWNGSIIKTAPNPLILFPQVYFALQEGVIRGYEPTSIGKRCNTEMNAAQPPSMLAMSPTPGWRLLREAEHRIVVHETSKGQGSPTGPRTLVIKL